MSTPHDPAAPFSRPISRLHLRNLLLDQKNPRFGAPHGTIEQAQLLDHIVGKFGVNDVLSSIAVNGYFDAEPLVCRKVNGSEQAVVVEGNRRVAACLILTGDRRAANQVKLTADFSRLWQDHGQKPVDPVPAIVFDTTESNYERALLSYLGVRHIASAQPWDSYAKAAWVARVVESEDIRIEDVTKMIGDQHRTVSRMLEGYYLVRQLKASGDFRPQDSIRRGRGSVTEFPFSWVYTVLGYRSVREFLALSDGDVQAHPLSDEHLEDGGFLLHAMFGDRSKARSAAIDDSRQLGDFAALFANRERVGLLRQGKALTEIEELTQPLDRRLSDGLSAVLATLRDLAGRLSETDIPPSTALEFRDYTKRLRKAAADLDERMYRLAHAEDDDESDG